LITRPKSLKGQEKQELKRRDRLKNKLIGFYARMSEITQPKCATECRLPRSCCSPEYCGMTIENARERWNTELATTDHPKLPLMGPEGCTPAPHFRPWCTLHLCSINALGFDKDMDFTKEYFKVRVKIDTAEAGLLE